MKKGISILMAAFMALALAPLATAQETTVTHCAKENCAFVDANGDGYCDNGDSRCAAFADADGDGVCDNCSGSGLHEGDGEHADHAGSSLQAKHSGGKDNHKSNKHNTGKHHSGKHGSGHKNGHN